MIDITSLTESDRGRQVVYQSRPNTPFEEGEITSWNDHYVFVRYKREGVLTLPANGSATPPDKPTFI